MRVADILAAAKSLISNPLHWCQGAARRTGPAGLQLCSQAALQDVFTVAHTNQRDAYTCFQYLNTAALQCLDRRMWPSSPNPLSYIFLNDHFDHEVVMEMWDTAIASARAAEMWEQFPAFSDPWAFSGPWAPLHQYSWGAGAVPKWMPPASVPPPPAILDEAKRMWTELEHAGALPQAPPSIEAPHEEECLVSTS